MINCKDTLPFTSLIVNNIRQDNIPANVYPMDMIFSQKFESLNVSGRIAF